MQTRGIIVEQYGLIARELYNMGNKEDARIVSQLAKEVNQADFTTLPQQRFNQANGKMVETNMLDKVERN